MPAPGDVPPVAEGIGLPWDVAVDDAVAAIAGAREHCGDTFLVESGGDHYLFTFSPVGVESLYALVEEDPDAMATVAASGKRAERLALDEIAGVVEDSVHQYDSSPSRDGGLFGRIVDAWAAEPAHVRSRGIAMDVALIHIASCPISWPHSVGRSSTCWRIRNGCGSTPRATPTSHSGAP